ncbi:hypothetical protein AMTRI_Chr09g36880 [Amborella trichopoda]
MAIVSGASIDPEKVISYNFPETAYTYTERDVVLYALGVGACIRSATDDNELKYVYNKDGQACVMVLPTFAVLFSPLSLQQVPGLVFNPTLLLHGEQYVEIYKPFPTSCCVQNKTTVSSLHDKGKAAIIEIESLSYDKESGEALCMNRSTIFLRGAGGFSKSPSLYSYSKNPPRQGSFVKIPKGEPFAVHEDCTQKSQALLYRLSGDYNPLHSDPMVASNAGFSRPILHGLCTLGFAVRAIIRHCCNDEPARVKSLSGRFLLHVYPGEVLVTEMWLQGSRVLYQTRVKERNKAVLAGYVTLDRLPSSL